MAEVEKIMRSSKMKKKKYIQIRVTEQFYDAVHSYAEKHELSVTDCIEKGLNLLMYSDSELDK